MPEPVLDDDISGWGVSGIQIESDNQYSSDENIEKNLGVGFNVHTPDFKKHFEAGTLWTTIQNQPDYSQNLPRYRLKKTKEVMDSRDTEMEQIDPGTLSRARRLSLQSDSTLEDSAQQPQRTDELGDMSPIDFPKMTPRVGKAIPLSKIPRRDQQQVMYES